MKNNLLIIIFLLLIACFAACSKGGNNTAPIPPRKPDSTVIMYANVDSLTWAADSVSGLLIPLGNDSGHYNLSITAKKYGGGNNSVMMLYITNYTGMGTYSISPPVVSATFYSGSARHYALSGQINVTNDSTADLQGTFNFVADSSTGMNVSNGYFRFPL